MFKHLDPNRYPFELSDIPLLRNEIAVIIAGAPDITIFLSIELIKRGASLILIGDSSKSTIINEIKRDLQDADVKFINVDFGEFNSIHMANNSIRKAFGDDIGLEFGHDSDSDSLVEHEGVLELGAFDFSELKSLLEPKSMTTKSLAMFINLYSFNDSEFKLSEDAIESNFQHNTLGPLMILLGVLPMLMKSPKAKISLNCSPDYRFAPILENFEIDRANLGNIERFAISQLANLLITIKLQEKFGSDLMLFNAFQLGDYNLGIQEEFESELGMLYQFLKPIIKFNASRHSMTLNESVLTPLYCSTVVEEHSCYFGPFSKLIDKIENLVDIELIDSLWELVTSIINGYFAKSELKVA